MKNSHVKRTLLLLVYNLISKVIYVIFPEAARGLGSRDEMQTIAYFHNFFHVRWLFLTELCHLEKIVFKVLSNWLPIPCWRQCSTRFSVIS